MNEQKNKSKKKNKSKEMNRCNKNNNSNSNYKKKSSSSNSNNKSIKNSKLCAFSSVDYLVLASTLAVALGEELPSNDISILASFFAVLSDELALIAAVDQCNSGDDNSSVFVAPIPDVAVTSSQNKSKSKKKRNKNIF